MSVFIDKIATVNSATPLLESYHWKKQLANRKIAVEALSGPQGNSAPSSGGGGGNSAQHQLEAHMAACDDVTRIEDAYELMDDEKHQIIIDRLFLNPFGTTGDLMDELHVETTRFYDMRKDAIVEFARCYSDPTGYGLVVFA